MRNGTDAAENVAVVTKLMTLSSYCYSRARNRFIVPRRNGWFKNCMKAALVLRGLFIFRARSI